MPAVDQAAIEDRWSGLWRRPERLSLSQWSEKHFRLSPEYSRVTNQLRLFGWQREIFDSFTDPAINKIVLKMGTQLTKTLFIQCAIAYVIAEAPGPILVAEPKDDDAKSFSRERIAPMLRDIEILHGKVLASKSRDSNNTIDQKHFAGGVLSIVGAGAPGNAARRSIRYAFLDEINKYLPSPEGDFVSLVEERTATFGTQKKIILACSPTVPEAGISLAYEQSDMRQPWVPCQACGEFQLMRWEQVRFDKRGTVVERALSAQYICEHCNDAWNDLKRWKSADMTVWRPRKAHPGVAGFGDLSHLMSPHKTMREIVEKWLSEHRDPQKRQSFINTNLARDYVEKGEAPEWRRLYERSRNEPHKLGIVPDGALFLTAGGDVQRDRIEVQVKGWGRGRQSWVVDYIVLEGNPTEPAVWLKLNEVLDRVYPNEAGVEFRIAKMAIDTGYATQEVYNWARQQGPGRVMAVKGMAMSHQSVLGQPSSQDIDWRGKKISNGIQVWPLGVGTIKSELYGWLSLPTPTESELEASATAASATAAGSTDAGAGYLPGYCHFTPELAEEYYEQLTAEELVSRSSKATKGYTVQEWVKRRERNEALDTAVYCRAAAAQVGIDRFGDREWAEMEAWVIKSAALVNRPAEAQANAKPAVTRRVFAKFRV